jgi:pyruvate,orthophosphate dikinase
MTTITGPVRPLVAEYDGDRALLGGKAWGIQRMLALGAPVPPAFVVTTEACTRHRAGDGTLAADVRDALPDAIAGLEQATGRTFGRGPSPLLVSVRSGAAVSMPGMMDTILNLGMTPDVQAALAEQTGDEVFAADTARRFAEQYEATVGVAPPADPWEQLHGAVATVFASWDSRRAIAYRRDRGLSEVAGTAVTVQAMVFGNLDDRSGTGVLFTRDPLTGDPERFGEWLPRAQGEDVVSGTHDPLHLAELAEAQPAVHEQLMTLATTLEREGRDVQDIEFTVESGRLWLLQTRAAKRSPAAAVRLAVALAQEGLISESEALDRVSPQQVAAVLRPHVEPHARAGARVLATGRPACPGVVSGVIVCDTAAAEERADAGEDTILARPTTDPEDVPAMTVVTAILTELGGATSHAAVVSRELGVPCVVGCGAGTLMGLEGRVVTVDAASGEILEGELAVVAPAGAEDDPDLAQLLVWARAEPGADAGATLPKLLEARRPVG